MKKTKRRKYLINKIFQFRFMGLVVVPLILISAALYYLIYYCVLNQMLIPEAVAVTLLPAMKKANSILVFVVPILLFLILRASLIYSNRIIGPIPRLEKELDKFIAGDRSVRISSRKKDELRSFISKVNAVLEKASRA